jgi:hypothetical protein
MSPKQTFNKDKHIFQDEEEAAEEKSPTVRQRIFEKWLNSRRKCNPISTFDH